MQKKKILCLVLAVSLLLGSALTAFATEGGEFTVSGNDVGVTVSGNGEVEYVSTVVYSVTLPTNVALGLKVDPQGLLTLEDNQTATEEELAEKAGKVWATGKPVISNRGSVPTKVTVALKLTGNATSVKTEDAVTISGNNPANNILLYAVPSAVDVKGDAANYSASTTGIVMETDKTAEVSFILDPAEYVFTRTVSDNNTTFSYSLQDENDKGHGTALSFEGKVNKYADWSDYVDDAEEQKTIGLTAVFTFTHTLSATDVATDGAPYGMINDGSFTTINVDAGPSIATTAFNHSGTTGSTVTVNLGSGSKAATSIAKLQAANTLASTFTDYAEGTYWSFDNTTSTLTITNKLFPGASVGDLRYVKVIFDDDESTEVILTLTKTS